MNKQHKAFHAITDCMHGGYQGMKDIAGILEHLEEQATHLKLDAFEASDDIVGEKWECIQDSIRQAIEEVESQIDG